MNAFEQIVESLLQKNGYWTMSSYKVHIDKEVKKRIGRDSSPRWEVDIIAYNVQRSELLIVECKSYIDSKGVQYADFKQGAAGNRRYKLFTEPVLRQEILHQIKRQLLSVGLVAQECTITLCLAAGMIRAGDQAAIATLFEANSWKLFDPNWIRSQLSKLSKESYSDDVTSIISKLLLRSRFHEDLTDLILEVPAVQDLALPDEYASLGQPLLCSVSRMSGLTEDGRHLFAEVCFIQRDSQQNSYRHLDLPPVSLAIVDVRYNVVAVVHGGVKHKDKHYSLHFKKYPKWKRT